VVQDKSLQHKNDFSYLTPS